MKKIYAKEIPCDVQETWDIYYNEEMACDNHIFLGCNKDFVDVNAALVNDVLQALDRIGGDIQYELDHNFDSVLDITIDVYRSIIEEHLHRQSSDKAFTDDEVINLTKLADRYFGYSTSEELDVACAVLSILYEEPFAYTTLRGCGQSDWVKCVYPKSRECDLKYIEAVFFGIGTEFAISCEPIESADEFDKVDTYCDYFVGGSEEKAKQWIATRSNCTPEEVALLLISNTRTVVQYDYKEV